jgi:hypothetical protein
MLKPYQDLLTAGLDFEGRQTTRLPDRIGIDAGQDQRTRTGAQPLRLFPRRSPV